MAFSVGEQMYWPYSFQTIDEWGVRKSAVVNMGCRLADNLKELSYKSETVSGCIK